MGKEANIFIIEDKEIIREYIVFQLKANNHNVVLTASTFEEAREKIQKMKELGIQVVVLDGNLTEGAESGYEGRELLEEIRREAPEAKVIGISLNPFQGVDIDLTKDSLHKLWQVVAEL